MLTCLSCNKLLVEINEEDVLYEESESYFCDNCRKKNSFKLNAERRSHFIRRMKNDPLYCKTNILTDSLLKAIQIKRTDQNFAKAKAFAIKFSLRRQRGNLQEARPLAENLLLAFGLELAESKIENILSCIENFASQHDWRKFKHDKFPTYLNRREASSISELKNSLLELSSTI